MYYVTFPAHEGVLDDLTPLNYLAIREILKLVSFQQDYQPQI